MPVTQELTNQVDNALKQGYPVNDIFKAIEANPKYIDVTEQINRASKQGYPANDILRAIKTSPSLKEPTIYDKGVSIAKDIGKSTLGYGEAAANFLTGIPNFFVDVGIATGAGYGTLAKGGSVEEASANIQGMQELVRPFITYQPKTKEGQEAVQGIGKLLHWLIGKPSEVAGEAVTDYLTKQAQGEMMAAGITQPQEQSDIPAAVGAGTKTLAELGGYTALFGGMNKASNYITGKKPAIPLKPLTDQDVIDFHDKLKQEMEAKRAETISDT